MSLTIQQIIEEADIRVPNSFSSTDKVDWLNEVNHEFFDVVKIPKIESFTTGTTPTTLANTDIRSKNIVKVISGSVTYKSMLYEDVNPGHNYYVYDEATKVLELDPSPVDGTKGIVKYYRIGDTTFTSSNIATDSPDAPEEYHWLYILGLCERIAKAMNDTVLANNYANDYRGNLIVAKQNHGSLS